MKKRVLFYRDFRGFTGGHLKVWDYFQHTRVSNNYEPRVLLSPESVRDSSYPWTQSDEVFSEHLVLKDFSFLFLGGMDWNAFPDPPPCPLINLIQSVRHAFIDDPRRQFLSRRALRICITAEVADAIESTGLVNGPVITIPIGVDRSRFPSPSNYRDIRLLIVGVKKPQLAQEISTELRRLGILGEILNTSVPRDEFLSLLGRSEIVLALPEEAEGFYLPAFEALAMESFLICPDCVGNRSFCIDRETCLRPPYDKESLIKSVREAQTIPLHTRRSMILRGKEIINFFGLEAERDKYLHVLEHLSDFL